MQNNIKKFNGLNRFILLSLMVLTISYTAVSCIDKKNKGTQILENPVGYDLGKPEKYLMPDILQEISGIAFNKGKSDVVYAQQDEDGILFKLPLGTKDETATKFGKKGDYEDVSVIRNWVILLKSNGELYSFPLSETTKNETTNVKVSENLVPKGEYEGIFADEETGKVYLFCKTCKVDKDTKNATGYILDFQNDGSFKSVGTFLIDVADVDKISGKKKGSFHPSALAINPLTKEWYIISSVNKALVVTDISFKIKSVYHLSSNEFNQPEGIAFDAAGNLYISNEGSELSNGNILRFDYKKP